MKNKFEFDDTEIKRIPTIKSKIKKRWFFLIAIIITVPQFYSNLKKDLSKGQLSNKEYIQRVVANTKKKLPLLENGATFTDIIGTDDSVTFIFSISSFRKKEIESMKLIKNDKLKEIMKVNYSKYAKRGITSNIKFYTSDGLFIRSTSFGPKDLQNSNTN